MVQLQAKHAKGNDVYPHFYKDGLMVATKSKNPADYVYTDSIEELAALIAEGYGARMSNPDLGLKPSHRGPGSIQIITSPGEVAPKSRDLLPRFTDDLDNMDGDSVTKTRREQTHLRLSLLGGRSIAPCILCGRELPSDVLVAAHLKKRSECEPSERKDYENVASLMCRLGCDEIYESLYVYIDGGRVTANSAKKSTPELDAVIAKIVGRLVPNWKSSRLYYEWHANRGKSLNK